MTEHLDVVIVGAGISGVSAAWHLQDRCPTKSYAILEKRPRPGRHLGPVPIPGHSFRLRHAHAGIPLPSLDRRKPSPTAGPSSSPTSGAPRPVRHRQADPATASKLLARRLVERRQPLDSDRLKSTVDRARSPAHSCSCAVAITTTNRVTRRRSPARRTSAGTIVHPQHWPEDLDYADKNIVVIGCGATAVTLVPALANSGARNVTMLQRSPTYIVSLPKRDRSPSGSIAGCRRRRAYTAVRWKNILRQSALYGACQKWPQRMRKESS